MSKQKYLEVVTGAMSRLVYRPVGTKIGLKARGAKLIEKRELSQLALPETEAAHAFLLN